MAAATACGWHMCNVPPRQAAAQARYCLPGTESCRSGVVNTRIILDVPLEQYLCTFISCANMDEHICHMSERSGLSCELFSCFHGTRRQTPFALFRHLYLGLLSSQINIISIKSIAFFDLELQPPNYLLIRIPHGNAGGGDVHVAP
jgi:hypothetical protein